MSLSRMVRVFRYIEELDAFVVTDTYRALADQLGLTEWNPVVWIGRLFTLDNDYGEHWFDNWYEREAMNAAAKRVGIESDDLLIVVADRFQNGKDGPCHPPDLRKQFWTDTLKSLELSYELLFAIARHSNNELRKVLPDQCIKDLDERIARINL